MDRLLVQSQRLGVTRAHHISTIDIDTMSCRILRSRVAIKTKK